MRRAFLLLPFLAAVAGEAVPGPAKEPAYLGEPRYALLELGSGTPARVWMVLDGDLLYVDRDADGDLTGAADRVEAGAWQEGFPITLTGADGKTTRIRQRSRTFEIGELPGREGGARHTRVRLHEQGIEGHPPLLRLEARIGDARIQAAGVSFLGERKGRSPADAPRLHFDGPLRMDLPLSIYQVVRGEAGYSLTARIGTPGSDEAAFAAISFESVPEGVHPVADLEFPPKAPGAEPPRLRVVLKERC